MSTGKRTRPTESDALPPPEPKRPTSSKSSATDVKFSPTPSHPPHTSPSSTSLPKPQKTDDAAPKHDASSSAPKTATVSKREDYLPWDDYFMGVAFLSAMRSKDPNTQVGACIVDNMNRIVGIGYNGFPRGCSDDSLPWAREAESPLDTKYLYVCHAEANAILNRNHADLRDCRMYVALFPCNECAKLIIQSGISEVVFLDDKYHETPSMTASRRMFDLAGVKYRQHTPRESTIKIEF